MEQRIRVERIAFKDEQDNEGSLWVTCLLAEEVNAPAGEKPEVWRLLSNREVQDLDEAAQLLDWYRARWEIELFFLILKEGCRIEALQLEAIERIETALALYMVVAWRINRLMRLGRALPELPADLLFNADECRAAYLFNGKPYPKKAPSLGEVMRLVAQVGGFLGRKGDGDAGAKTLWLGMRDIAISVQTMRAMRYG